MQGEALALGENLNDILCSLWTVSCLSDFNSQCFWSEIQVS